MSFFSFILGAFIMVAFIAAIAILYFKFYKTSCVTHYVTHEPNHQSVVHSPYVPPNQAYVVEETVVTTTTHHGGSRRHYHRDFDDSSIF